MSTLLVDDASPHFATIRIRPWADAVIDALGHDPRSAYVERFWLPVLGPSTTWLIRLLAAELEANPPGFDLDLAQTAQVLGLGSRGGRHSPFMRALGRCCRFDLADSRADGSLAVRRKLPPLNRRQLIQLPPSVQESHRQWQEADLAVPAAEQLRRRCRRLALSLFELGEDVEATERQLLRWKFPPALAGEAVAWAWDRARTAQLDAYEPGGGSPGAA